MKLFRKNPGLFPILGLCLFSCPIFIWVLLMFYQIPLFGGVPPPRAPPEVGSLGSLGGRPLGGPLGLFRQFLNFKDI